MSRRVRIETVGAELKRDLTIYGREVAEAVNAEGRKAMKDLVKRTKATAPIGNRGTFRRNIAMKETQNGQKGIKHFTWYVKPPDHRLTHLLVHGHATKDGGRTKADPFLQNALDRVLPEYEAAIEEAIKND